MNKECDRAESYPDNNTQQYWVSQKSDSVFTFTMIMLYSGLFNYVSSKPRYFDLRQMSNR